MGEGRCSQERSPLQALGFTIQSRHSFLLDVHDNHRNEDTQIENLICQ